MKPEELAKESRMPLDELIANLLKKKPNDVFTAKEIRFMFRCGDSTVRHYIVNMPDKNKVLVMLNGHKENVIGSEKAINKFKSLL